MVEAATVPEAAGETVVEAVVAVLPVDEEAKPRRIMGARRVGVSGAGVVVVVVGKRAEVVEWRVLRRVFVHGAADNVTGRAEAPAA